MQGIAGDMTVRVERLVDAPIISPATHSSIGANIQGPSLIRVPIWVEAPLGTYYLYFADHKGRYIRLAYADHLTGPWTVYPPGSLQLEDSHFLSAPPAVSDTVRQQLEARDHMARTCRSHDIMTEATTPHIASPDVHVDHGRQHIAMYYHGLEDVGKQVTRVALSSDGVHFTALPEVLGRSYFRVFHYRGATYAMAMPGQLYRSEDGLSSFEAGPLLFNPDMRHAALLRRGTQLYVFWTQVGEAPERILLSSIDLRPDWSAWKVSDPIEVLRPERDWEGADAPLVPSIRSTAYGHVNQLRDPAIFEEDGNVFLLYAVAGESGIAIAQVFLDDDAST
jgi:hypothetical protein